MSQQVAKEQKAKPSKAQQLLTDLLLGGVAGVISKTIMAPLERIKLLLQTMESHQDVTSGKIKPYAGIADCGRRVYNEQGFKAFWRGNFANCLRYAPQQGSALAFNDFINNLFAGMKYDAKTDFWKSLGFNLLSGGLAGAIANTVCYPFDFARTRLASDLKSGSPQYKGIVDCISTTYSRQGIRGIYTGWSVTVAGAFIYRAGQLGCFKQIQELNPYKKDKGTLGAVSAFVAVTTARTIIMPFNYPFDTIRRRMMLESELPKSQRVYAGCIDCLCKIHRKEGFKGLYKGLVPELFRGIGGSLVIVAYDRVKVIFGI